MSKFRFLASVLILVVVPAARAEPLLLCGGDEVFLVETGDIQKGTIKKVWSWRGKDCAELPEPIRKLFGTTDDCRPTDGVKTIMISSSGGAVALVDRATGRALWYARVPNAHGIELLPGGRIVAASSVSNTGNRLMLFDRTTSDVPIAETPLPSAHGVVWDAGRKRLWALGGRELRRYALKDWSTKSPSLALESTFELPDGGGHDLSAVPGADELVVTTGGHVFLFDRTKETFLKHSTLGDRKHVKAIAVHPQSGRLAFTEAQDRQWWTSTLRLQNPAGEVVFPGEHLYRIRWLVPN
jgi:hypothetical protein